VEKLKIGGEIKNRWRNKKSMEKLKIGGEIKNRNISNRSLV
jgi:hypothetical protein